MGSERQSAPLASIVCQWSFDSDIRKRGSAEWEANVKIKGPLAGYAGNRRCGFRTRPLTLYFARRRAFLRSSHSWAARWWSLSTTARSTPAAPMIHIVRSKAPAPHTSSRPFEYRAGLAAAHFARPCGPRQIFRIFGHTRGPMRGANTGLLADTSDILGGTDWRAAAVTESVPYRTDVSPAPRRTEPVEPAFCSIGAWLFAHRAARPFREPLGRGGRPSGRPSPA